MWNNKLISLLKTLTREEFRVLARIVASPVHNKHTGVIRLFTCLRKQIEGGNGLLEEEKVMQEVFSEKSATLQDLHYVNSYLLKVVEEFLAWSEWKKDDAEKGIYLLRAYQNHGLEKPFLKNLKKTHGLQEKKPLRNSGFLRKNYQLQLEEYNYSESLGRVRSFNLQVMSRTHDQSYTAEKLKTACILLSHQAVSKTKYDTGLLDAVLSHVAKVGWDTIPAIGIYYHGYQALTDFEDDAHFSSLKKLLLEHPQAFAMAELRDIYILAINCCIRRLNIGKRNFLREVFDLYKAGLELNVFLTNDQLSPWTYSNIIVSGLKFSEFEWTYQFIFNYRKNLPENQRESLFNYNLARYYYELKDYTQAMPLLQKIEYDDLLHNLSAKALLAKMYYELSEYDALHNLLASFKTFIYRKKGLGYHRDHFLTVIHFIQKLQAVNNYDKKEREKLIAEVKASKVSEKEWLLEQLVGRQPQLSDTLKVSDS